MSDNRSTQATQHAANILHEGGLVVYPTEAVYGIGCDPGNAEAINRLLSIKGRPASKGLILVAADFNQLERWTAPMTAEMTQRILPTWPGPHTWIVPPIRNDLPLLLGEHRGLAVRISDHPMVIELCRAFGGAIVSTSANRSGESAKTDITAIRAQFGTAIDYYLDGPLGGRDRPSEIRDALTGAVLRA